MRAISLFCLLCYSLQGISQNNATKDSLPLKKIKNYVYFIPSEVDRINGLAIGLWAENSRSYRDSLEINGLCLEINPVILFIYARGIFTIPENDSIETYYREKSQKLERVTKKGVNISIPGTIGEYTTHKGFNLTPISTAIGEMHGVSISGLTNSSYVLNGISIAGLYNSSKKARGVQIGLINKAKSLRGFQFGLWNKNGKRSLPFVNWQFRD